MNCDVVSLSIGWKFSAPLPARSKIPSSKRKRKDAATKWDWPPARKWRNLRKRSWPYLPQCSNEW